MRAIKCLIAILCLLVVLVLALLTARTAGADALEIDQLCLEQQANTSTYNAAGEVIGYSYRIINCGTTILTGPFWVSSSRVPNIQCQQMMWGSPPNWYLLPGNWISCTGETTVGTSDMAKAYILSVAYAEGSGLRSSWALVYVYNGTFQGLFLPVIAS